MVSQQHGYISGQREAALSNSPAARLKADIGNLAQIGTSLEEYAVDHNGKHPHSLQELLKANRGAYMSQTPTVPGSGGSYTLLVPPTDDRMGAYEIVDDGSIGADPSLTTIDGSPCDPAACTHVLLAARGAGSLYGAP